MFRDDERLFLSRPIRIEWDGWESNTLRLQQAGWEFSAEQSMELRGVRLFMRNSRCQMYGATGMMDVNFFEAHSDPRFLEQVRFQVGHMASNFTIQMHETGPIMARPVDMQPTMAMWGTIKSIEDLGIFAVPLVRTEGVYLDDASVPELMDVILKAQDPAKKAYFEEQVRQGRMTGADSSNFAPQQKFHAQIISFPQAA